MKFKLVEKFEQLDEKVLNENGDRGLGEVT